ncbi:winged helix-turn-helix transcriptional regulator [Noviherbaspirillum pedocola]|uniref:Helix-turn-helix transcriptional regulator n=1 Tax=Noviherbaspirillum pedocola TaxID=2801341 RepID=A0A934ST22_9BURK|nr:helix-turn-helix domain-containing protein [Noviherbaspirillum pedocola]MBK4735004.1 helix-turn-helix transcriptional regulator [Noviherbaspirillum pedocola]
MNASAARHPVNPLVVSETCPPRRIHMLLTPKWTSMVIYVLSFGPLRTGQLQRSMPGISKKMLTQTLRELEGDQLISRTVHQVVPPAVEYALTDLGRRFVEPLLALYDWADANGELLDIVERNRAASGGTDATGAESVPSSSSQAA